MLRFCEAKVAKGKFYCAKKLMNIWDVNDGNIAISKLVGRIIITLIIWLDS